MTEITRAIVGKSGATHVSQIDTRPPPPPALTNAERAAPLEINAPLFWEKLQVLLISKGGVTTETDVRAHVKGVLAAALAGGVITAGQEMAARIRVETASRFLRQDPDKPGLLDAVAQLLGLTSDQIDVLFLEANGLPVEE